MASAPEEFGSYLVYEQLGVGGMASVHVAEARSAGGFRKRVALKRLLPHAAADPVLLESFTHEARLARYLHHANIPQTFDFGCVDGTYFIAMELVAGPTLGQLIRQCKSTFGAIPFPITLNILCQVCDALEYAHTCVDENGASLGIIHRDVSPPNIIISNTGVVKLIDFGLAKAKTAQVDTQVGILKGKFRYMAPEYISGKLDRRVDVWALGAVAHELLTTKQLFDGDTELAVLDSIRRMPIVPPSASNPDVPPELDEVVMGALERDPDHRWKTAASMKKALFNVAAELQTMVTNAQLLEWTEWAFTQEPPSSNSELSNLINLLETPSKLSGKRRRNEERKASEPAFDGRTLEDPAELHEEDPEPRASEETLDRHTVELLDRHADKALARLSDRTLELRPDDQVVALRTKDKATTQPRDADSKRRAERTSVVRRVEVQVGGRAGRQRLFSTPRVGAAIAKRGRAGGGRTFVLLLLLALVVAGVYAGWYFGYVDLSWLQNL